MTMFALTASWSNPYDQPDKTFFHQRDKQLHIGFSAAIALTSNAIAHQEFELTYTEAWWVGLVTALAIGAAKEVFYDTNGDWGDMGANAIGGVIGTTGMYTIYTW